MNRATGSRIFLSLLRDEGITHLFGNPGTTELPLMDALKDHPDLTYVLGLQESVVVTMADGFARASGKLAACNVHVAPGLGNAMGAIYNAKFTGAPLLITAGQQEQGHGLTEPLLYDPLVPIASPLVKWATEITRLEDMPRIVRRAAKIATTPPTGPVFLSLPGDVLNDETGVDLGKSTRVDTRTRPTEETLTSLARRLVKAERPALLVGHEVVTSEAFEEIARFADVLGAPTYQQTVPYGAHFPSEHPAFMGALSRDQMEVSDILAGHDLLVVAGADVLRMSVWSPTDPLPPDLPLIQLGQLDWEMGKNYPVEIAIRADLKATLGALIPVLEAIGGDQLRAAAVERLAAVADRNWCAKSERVRSFASAKSTVRPVAGDWLMMQIVDALPKGAVVVNEGLTAAGTLLDMLPFRDVYGFHAFASGGIGWAIAAAIGIQLARPARPVVAVIGDGSAMYTIQALWTAAHLDLPVTYVIANNRSYRILKQRLQAFHGNDHFVGMNIDDPPIDFTGLARSLGLDAIRIDDPGDIRGTLERAIASQQPTLLEVMVERGV